eukprot:3804912-Alexandrium_andersonii.AAC.1
MLQSALGTCATLASERTGNYSDTLIFVGACKRSATHRLPCQLLALTMASWDRETEAPVVSSVWMRHRCLCSLSGRTHCRICLLYTSDAADDM